MKKTNFGKAVQSAAIKHLEKPTQEKIAEISKINQATINRVINREQRPDIETLLKLCTCWGDSATNVRVLIEHLRDEVERAGHPDGSVAFHANGESRSETVSHTLELIRSQDPESHKTLERLVLRLWDLLSSQHSDRAPRLLVAEDTAPYNTRRKPRKPS